MHAGTKRHRRRQNSALTQRDGTRASHAKARTLSRKANRNLKVASR